MRKVENLATEFEIEVKRFYLPAKLTMNCDVCGEEFLWDFEDSYLTFPRANVKQTTTVYCYNDHETKINFKLNINVELLD